MLLIPSYCFLSDLRSAKHELTIYLFFYRHGVSGHKNHSSIYSAMAYLGKNLTINQLYFGAHAVVI